MSTFFFQPVSACPLCQSQHIVASFKSYYWAEYIFNYNDCNNCGATFANPMPNDALITLGNTALINYYQREKSTESEFRDARQAYLRGKLFAKKLIKWKRSGILLELGCYQGFFALGVKENSNWTVEGLEISPELSHFVNTTLGVKCWEGTLEQTQVLENRFDFVICHDLIEHINQPETFILQLKRLLAPGGRLQIITPNATQDLSLARRSYKCGITWSMLLNHILYFRPKTLRKVFEAHGFKVIKNYTFDMRHAAKDFGWFGLGKPDVIDAPPAMRNHLQSSAPGLLHFWTNNNLEKLKRHRKVSRSYGFIKETLPRLFSIRVPERLEVGHEIYCLVEKL